MDYYEIDRNEVKNSKIQILNNIEILKLTKKNKNIIQNINLDNSCITQNK